MLSCLTKYEVLINDFGGGKMLQSPTKAIVSSMKVRFSLPDVVSSISLGASTPEYPKEESHVARFRRRMIQLRF